MTTSTTRWTGLGFLFIAIVTLLVSLKIDETNAEAVHKNPVEECNWVIKPGKARALIKVWTWDNKIQACHETVLYGDEEDKNIFADKKDCMDTCGPKPEKIKN